MDLWAVLTGLLSEAPTGHPGWLLHLLQWLPDDGAVAAVYASRPGPPRHVTTEMGPRRWYGWGAARHLAADTWDLIAATAGGDKRPPRYPRPQHPAPPRDSVYGAEYRAVMERIRHA